MSTNIEKNKNPLNKHIGDRLKLRRTSLGYTQEKIAGFIGVTFQQIQKYEKGINRISANRLFELSNALSIPITFFFEGFYSLSYEKSLHDSLPKNNVSPINSLQSLEVLKLFWNLPEEKRDLFMNILKSI